MTRHFLFCWPPLSSRPGGDGAHRRRLAPTARLVVACLVVLTMSGPAVVPGIAGCDDCGAVRGSVAVEQATVRAEGPKNDLDVVVVLDRVGGADPPPATTEATMDQRGLVFIPHVLAVQRGTTVTFLNNDNDEHNVYFLNDQTGDTLDIGTWGQGVSVDHTFDEEGTIITLCKLHLEMAAYVVVVKGPWFVQIALDASSRQGEFVIENVPPGEYKLSVWHKKLKQKGGTTTVSVGRGESIEVNSIITKSKYAKAVN